ncbi:MAG: cadherin domain-containing protein, partial [Pirellulaceae bacterium]
MLASLAGEVWADTNSDGIRNSNESGVIDARVYLDLNDNQQFSPNEPFVRTDSAGQYLFELVPPGNAVVRVELQAGQTQSTPQSYFGVTQVAGNNGTESRLFEMNGAGSVSLLGANSQTPIDGLVETNAGILVGIDSQADIVYQINKATGATSQLSAASVDLNSGLAYDPLSDTIYATARVDNALQLMIVDAASGQVSEPVVHVEDVLVSNFGSTFFDFNVATQTAVAIPRNGGFFASTLDQRSDGAVFGLQGSQLIQYTVTPTGSSGQVASTLSQSITSISFGANDQLYGVSALPSMFHQINPITGTVNPGIPITFNGASISGVAGFDIAADGTHYLVDSTHLYTFDPVTGVATQAPNRGITGEIFSSLSVAADGSLYATLFSTTTPVASIDPVTGLATRLGNGPLGAPYSAIVAGDSFATAAPLAGAQASALTFDPSTGRIIGFDDATDRFFEFNALGRGKFLANAARPLNSSSLAFNGASFLMFDADDAAGTSILKVNPDTGSITAAIQSSAAVAPAALDFAARSTAHRVNVAASQSIAGLGFGLQGNVNTPPLGSGLFINELLVDPLFGNADSQQAIEIRGEANSTIADGTYFVVIEEFSSNTTGEIQVIIDLSGQRIGSNGFLVLLAGGSPFTTAPGANVLQSTLPGFGGLPGNIFSDVHPLSDRLHFITSNSSYMLVNSQVAPQLGADIDVDNDGLADPDGVVSNWNIIDSIGMHPSSIGGNTYSQIAFINNISGIPADFVHPEGGHVILSEGSGYAARVGDSIGSDPEDWIVSTVTDELNSSSGIRLGLEDGIFGPPTQLAFQGRDLDHFGDSNFVGGVRGTVALRPVIEGDPITDPAQGVTVLADTNGNQRQDVLSYTIDPDNYDVGLHLINSLPGVTLNTARADGSIVGFEVNARAESFFNQNGNRVFSSAGIPWFSASGPLRADFYRPARAVSIDGIGTSSATFIRLDAYDVDGNLLGSTTSRNLVGAQRERLTLSFSGDVIAYAMAYSADSIVDANGSIVSGSPFGKLDRFSYSQGEAITKTDKFGRYEISNLFPDNYQISFINDPGNRELIGAQSVPVTIQRYENFILGPNLEPTTADLEVTIAENSPAGTSLGTIDGTDDNGQPTFSILAGQESGIRIDSVTGQLTIGPSANLDFETTPIVGLEVGVIDSLGAVAISRVTIQLTDVNEAPVIQSSQINVTEDTVVGTTVGRILATDPDTQPADRLLNYSIIGGTGANLFSIDADSGFVTLSDPSGVNFEDGSQLTLVVQVADNGETPQSVTQTQIVTIGDANDAPQLVIPELSIVENTVGKIGDLSVVDQDQNQVHTYRLVGGSGESLFNVLPNGAIVVRPNAVLDFEAGSSYQLNVSVVDNGVPALRDTGVVNILLTDVDEPARAFFTNSAVGENAVAGDVVGRIDLTDDEGAVENYTISLLDEGDSGLFELRPLTSQTAGVTQVELVVKEGAQFDFETKPALNVVFQISDLANNNGTVRLEKLISVLNENDAPTVVTTQVIVSEGALPGPTPLARLRFADVDPSETFSATIVGGTGASFFRLNPVTHVLTLADGAALDADVPDPTLTLEVQVTDSGGLSTV